MLKSSWNNPWVRRFLLGSFFVAVVIAGIAFYRSRQVPPLPEATVATDAEGATLAQPDNAALTEWCRRVGLPSPPYFGGCEPQLWQQWSTALADAAQTRSAEALGNVGRFLLSMGYAEASEVYFLRACEADRIDDRWFYYLGVVQQLAGHWDRAIVSLERASRLNPNYPATSVRLGHLYLRASDLLKAAGAFQRYLQNHPAEVDGFLGMGEVALAKQGFQQALPLLTRAVQVDPDNPRAHELLARALTGLGREQEAEAHRAKSRQRHPQGPTIAADTLLADVELLTGPATELLTRFEQQEPEEDWPVLAALARSIVRWRPGDTVMRQNLASICRKLNRFAEAHETLDTARRIRPRVPALWAAKAEVYFAEKNYPAAVGAAEEALRLDPDSAAAHNVLGRAQYLQERFDEALKSMRRAVELAPEHSGNWLALAEMLLRMQKREDALAAYERVIQLDPHNDRAAKRLAELRGSR